MTLPAVSSAFRWRRETWGHVLGAVALDSQAQHLFTTKQPQLPPTQGDSVWSLVAASLGGDLHSLRRIKQVHGNTVCVVHDTEAGGGEEASAVTPPQADAIISNLPGAILAVQVADCVPMLVVDVRTGAAGAVHAGWRGTKAGIGAATIAALGREFASDPRDLRVALGPSIGACCYEVGEELLREFRDAGASEPELARWFTRAASGSLCLDLWAANRDQLVAAGVARDHIATARLCTQTHADVFDSFRVAGPRAGRMIAAVRVPATN